MTESLCPCCGQKTVQKLPIVDLDNNRVSFGDTRVYLSPTRTEMLHAIVSRYPRTVSRDTIVADMWGTCEPEDAYNTLKTQLCYLRRDTRELPFELVTVQSKGVRLRVKEDTNA
jgi:DNA-binding response OmpR family regulator